MSLDHSRPKFLPILNILRQILHFKVLYSRIVRRSFPVHSGATSTFELSLSCVHILNWMVGDSRYLSKVVLLHALCDEIIYSFLITLLLYSQSWNSAACIYEMLLVNCKIRF